MCVSHFSSLTDIPVLTHTIHAVNSHVPVPIVTYWILSAGIPDSLKTYEA